MIIGLEHPVHGKMLILQVSLEDVQQRNISDIKDMIECAFSAESFSYLAGKMLIVFDGFDADKREIYEIDEIRSFISALTSAVPWWFAAIHHTIVLPWVASILPKAQCDRERQGSVGVFLDIMQAKDLLTTVQGNARKKMQVIGVDDDDQDTIGLNMQIVANQILNLVNPGGAGANFMEMFR